MKLITRIRKWLRVEHPCCNHSKLERVKVGKAIQEVRCEDCGKVIGWSL